MINYNIKHPSPYSLHTYQLINYFAILLVCTSCLLKQVSISTPCNITVCCTHYPPTTCDGGINCLRTHCANINHPLAYAIQHHSRCNSEANIWDLARLLRSPKTANMLCLCFVITQWLCCSNRSRAKAPYIYCSHLARGN